MIVIKLNVSFTMQIDAGMGYSSECSSQEASYFVVVINNCGKMVSFLLILHKPCFYRNKLYLLTIL